MELQGYLGVYASVDSFGTEKSNKSCKKSGKNLYFWFVWEDGKDYIIQRFDAAQNKAWPLFDLAHEDFNDFFVAQPHITILPEGNTQGDDMFYQKKTETDFSFSSENYTKRECIKAFELDHALRLDFAMALIKYKQEGTGRSLQFFERILDEPDLIAPHKHMFTDFGTELRKLGLHDFALKMYQRVIELAPEDTHAYCNLGRIYYELKLFAKAAKCAKKALEFEPSLDYARQLLTATESKM